MRALKSISLCTVGTSEAWTEMIALPTSLNGSLEALLCCTPKVKPAYFTISHQPVHSLGRLMHLQRGRVLCSPLSLYKISPRVQSSGVLVHPHPDGADHEGPGYHCPETDVRASGRPRLCLPVHAAQSYVVPCWAHQVYTLPGLAGGAREGRAHM